MLQCLSHIQANLGLIFQNSGHIFQQNGQYYQCLNNKPEFKYNFVTFGSTDPNMIISPTWGFCLPRQCQPDLIKQLLNKALQQVHYPFFVASVNNAVQDYSYPYDWAFYCLIIIFVALISLTIYSTFKHPKGKLSLFSFQESSKIFKRNQKSTLNVFNGVKSLAMMWVIIGHVYSNSAGGTENNPEKILLKPQMLIIVQGIFSVDVFFYVGGFLVSFVVFRQSNKNGMTYLIGILQRILRFWPSYIVAIMIYYSVYLHLGQGPAWGQGQDLQQVLYCKNMWKSLFFVDNLIDNGQTMCMNWGWYLQNDMQLFIYSMLILYIYQKSPLSSKLFLWGSIIGSMVYTFIYVQINQIPLLIHIADISKQGHFQTDNYIKPWARAPPYLFGLFMGMLFMEYLEQKKQKNAKHSNLILTQQVIKTQAIKNLSYLEKLQKIFISNKKVRIICEILGIIIMAFVVFIPRTLQVDIIWPQTFHSLYAALTRFLFVLGLTLTILPSLLGCKRSMVIFLMDTNLFNFIAKVSFCTYLIHLTILQIFYKSRTYDRYYTEIPILSQYCAILILSLTFGFLMTMLVEAPFTKLQKLLINTCKKQLSAKITKSKVPQNQLQNQEAMNSSQKAQLNLNRTLIST